MEKAKPQPKLSEIKGDLGILKGDVGVLKNDVGTLKGDVGVLKEDVKTLKSTIATKLATKQELSAFREESEEFFVAIKNDLDNTATKDDLIRLENKVDKLGEKLESTIQEKFGKILDGQDKVIKLLIDHQSEGAANLLAHDRMDGSLEVHGKRISVLEAKAGVTI